MKVLSVPPQHFNQEQSEVWREIIESAQPGLLTSSDRFAVELAVFVITDYRSGTSRPVGYRQAESVLRSCGLTPRSRLKIMGPKPGRTVVQ